MLENFVTMMKNLLSQSGFKSFGYLNIKNIFVHNNRLFIGEPILITDLIEKKIR